jgi:hypothetical protein
MMHDVSEDSRYVGHNAASFLGNLIWHNLFTVASSAGPGSFIFMKHKNDEEQTGQSIGMNDYGTPTASDMQEAAATGANSNEQGQASFVTGSTTGGGSNYGQGSSQLGGESYRQGSKTNTGSNYNNEAESLGSSATGTSNEGSSSPMAGAAQSGNNADTSYAVGNTTHDNDAGRENPGQDTDKEEEEQEEYDSHNTALEQDSGLSQDNTSAGDRPQSGSWSRSSTGDE